MIEYFPRDFPIAGRSAIVNMALALNIRDDSQNLGFEMWKSTSSSKKQSEVIALDFWTIFAVGMTAPPKSSIKYGL